MLLTLFYVWKVLCVLCLSFKKSFFFFDLTSLFLLFSKSFFPHFLHNSGYPCQVAAEHVQVLNDVRSRLPFLVTTADDAIDSVKEEIRLR